MGKKILIIDDDPVIVEYLEALFDNNGYETSVAYDGKEGEVVAKTFQPDLITLDLEMPKEWGVRFYRNLSKKMEGFNDIPVIIISGLPGRTHSIKKAIAYFAKPFDEKKLLATVEEAIG